MTKKISWEHAVKLAKEVGVDFNKDFHAQSKGAELSAIAKLAHYKKSPTAPGSTGRMFFYYLLKKQNKK
jgi:hypothetical protein